MNNVHPLFRQILSPMTGEKLNKCPAMGCFRDVSPGWGWCHKCGYECTPTGDACCEYECQICCPHDERDHGICLACSHDKYD